MPRKTRPLSRDIPKKDSRSRLREDVKHGRISVKDALAFCDDNGVDGDASIRKWLMRRQSSS